jgi:transposase
LYLALELSNAKWELTFGDGSTRRRKVEVKAGERNALSVELRKAKKHFGMTEGGKVVSCYEAGRDGFWIHRYLLSEGVENRVIDSSSIEVPRRGRRVKNDRLDGESLLRILIRHENGERRVCSVLRIPSEEEEDARRVHRELERLKKERCAHRVRMQSLLVTQGVGLAPVKNFAERLEKVRTWERKGLGEDLKKELAREYERLQLAEKQIKEIEKVQQERLAEAPEEKREGETTAQRRLRMVKALMALKGVKKGAWLLVMEYFGWRKFRNRREVGSAAGLTGTPYNSGDGEREQGISKAGNRRVRALMIELAWCWLRFQGQSKRSQWFKERFERGKRMKRVGIVALARQLLVDFWRYLESGELPEGAELKAA